MLELQETPALMSILFVGNEAGKTPSTATPCWHGKSVPNDPRRRDADSVVVGVEGSHGILQMPCFLRGLGPNLALFNFLPPVTREQTYEEKRNQRPNIHLYSTIAADDGSI